MKKRISVLLILVIIFTILTVPSSAEKGNNLEPVTIPAAKASLAPKAMPIQMEEQPTMKTTNNSRVDEQIYWQVVSSGGQPGTAGEYGLNGTIGQTAVGIGNEGDNTILHGFWHNFTMICDCEPGEADGDIPISILDVVYIINYKYKGGPDPIPYALCNADPDANCDINILDVVYIINYKYKQGPLPATCEEWTSACGSLR